MPNLDLVSSEDFQGSINERLFTGLTTFLKAGGLPGYFASDVALRNGIFSALNGLPSAEKAVILGRVRRGSYANIAQELRISEGQARSLGISALERISREITDLR
jgi:DNA-directed RNA polymerase specialized sigma24 family protein